MDDTFRYPDSTRTFLQCEQELSVIYDNAFLSIFILDSSGRIQKINKLAARFAGRPYEEVIGLRYGEVFHCHRHDDAPDGCGSGDFCGGCPIRNAIHDTIEHKKNLNQVEVNQSLRINGRMARLSFLVSTGTVLVNDQTMVLVCLMDITQRKKDEAALQIRNALLAASAQVSQILFSEQRLDKAINESLFIIGNASLQDRVYIFECHTEASTGERLVSQRYEWVQAGISQQIDNPELQNVPLGQLAPRWFEFFDRGEAIQGPIKDFPEPEREILESQGIVSLLAVPIIIERKLWGFLGFDNCHVEYEWGEGERSVLMTTSSLFAQCIIRKRVENALRESESWFLEAQRTSCSGSYVYHLNEDRWESSVVLDEIFGIDAAYPRNMKSWVDLIHPDDRAATLQAFQDAIDNRTDFSKEYRIIHHVTGEERWLHGFGGFKLDNSGNMIRFGMIQDITKAKYLELKLIQAQKMEAVGHLAGGIAHDFNNKLAVILGYTGMMLDKGRHLPMNYEDLEEVHKAASLAADLTDQLLIFSRKKQVSPQLLDLNQVISGMVKMLKRLIGENIELVWNPGKDLWTIKIDRAQFDQILANLSVNARDAILSAGTLTIETKNISLDADFCDSHFGYTPGDYVMLIVTDTGAGIDKATLQHVFEPFFTTKEEGKGTGLGLATVYGIVKQNSGFIDVYSEVGMGTSFKIFLPRAKAASNSTSNALSEQNNPFGTETILLVEDDDALLQFTKRILEQYGYNVISTASPLHALNIAKLHEETIHLLFTDVVMPQMNGKELKDAVKKLLPGVKTLYASAYTSDVIARQGVIDEGVDFLHKPYSITQLLQKIREILG